MQKTMKTLALGAILAVLGGGLANAAEDAMKMDCCAKCECCKDKKAEKPAQPAPEHQH